MKKESSKLPKEILAAAWAIALGAIAPMLDSTMVNIAIDNLIKEFDTTLNIIQWSVTGYILAIAIAVPVSGWLMNKYNGKKVFLYAVIAFGLISLLISLSFDAFTFIVFRFFQGFSAGIISTLMMTLLVKTAGQERLGRVIAIVSTPMIFGPIFGPVIGGFIIQFASWHWIFLINIFIVLISTPLMIKYIPEFEPFDRQSRLDVLGIIILTIMSVTLIFGVTKAADYATFNNIETILWLSGGVIFAGIYLLHNRIKQNRTAFPLNLFKYKTYLASITGLFLANIAIIGPMVILPLFFITIHGFTPIGASLALMPQGIAMLVTRPFIGKLIDAIGAKYVVIVSLIIALVGSIPLIFINEQTSFIFISSVLFIRGTSVGGIMLALMSDAYTGIRDKQLPQAGVGINIIENLGSSFGTAIIATVVATVTGSIQQSIVSDLKGFHAGFLVSVIVLVLIFIPSIFLTRKNHVSQ